MHRQGAGKLQHIDCTVKFDLYIPKNWKRHSYMLLIGRGNHSHFPPPPEKLPRDIQKDLSEAIMQHNLLEITSRTLMISPLMKSFLAKYSKTALRDLHPSLLIEDRITALIKKQKLLQYPHGSDLAGVQQEFEFERARQPEDQWIRDIYFFDEEKKYYMIICCSYAQAKAFTTVRHIEMDLAFKTVQGKTMVYSIAAYNPDARRINTYAYVYINRETPETYRILFERLFQELGNAGRQPVKWAYQTGKSDSSEGIRTVTLDMSRSQARGTYINYICNTYVIHILYILITFLGFGEYLATAYPEVGLSWREHLPHVLVFCETHIRRAYRKKFGGDHPGTGALDDLFTAKDIHTARAIMTEAVEKWPDTKNWYQNKEVPWILAGITREASKIPINWWIAAQHHTGACESSHFVDNEAVGRKKSLLGAVLGYD
jgi:hypothetical protein